MERIIKSVQDLQATDNLGEIFKFPRLRYNFSGLHLLHSEVKDQVLRCLAFDRVENQASYLEFDSLNLNVVDPIIFVRVFDEESFVEPVQPKEFVLDYHALFEDVDFNLSNLSENQRLKFHLYGQFSSQRIIENYSSKVNLAEFKYYEYPGCDFQRIVTTFNNSNGKSLSVTELKALISV